MTSSLDIRTKRLLITPFSKRHLTERYVGWLNDHELMRFSEQRHKAHTMESCYAYWQSFEGTSNYFWAIEEVEHNFGHIGNINAYVDKNNLLADIGILIGEKKAHKRRYGIEAWIGVCHFLFQKAGMRKITAGTLSANLPMLKLARHVGMIEDGVRKMHYVNNNQEVDIIYMALFKEQWGGLIASDESEVFKKYLRIAEF
jgi:ribosomal-protein-alanine N-acetyltransferase